MMEHLQLPLLENAGVLRAFFVTLLSGMIYEMQVIKEPMQARVLANGLALWWVLSMETQIHWCLKMNGTGVK